MFMDKIEKQTTMSNRSYSQTVYYPSPFFYHIVLLLSLFILVGCEMQGSAPTVQTVYIEEIVNKDDSEIDDVIKQILENSEALTEITPDENRGKKPAVESAKSNSASEGTIQNIDEIKSEETIVALAPPSIELQIEESQSATSKSEIDTSTEGVSQSKTLEENTRQQSKLENAALQAAFKMLAERAMPVQIMPKNQNSYTQKQDTKEQDKSKFRIGLMVPLSGPFSYLGNTIAGGSELAFFKMKNPNVELLYFDTAGGQKIIDAANDAIASDVDVVIGPVFSDSVIAIKPIFKQFNIPVLSFSNNIDVAESGFWVLGYLPEHQISQLIDFAIARKKQNFGIISSSSQLGTKITNAAIQQLGEYGLLPSSVLYLDDISMMEQQQFLSKIKKFTQYVDTTKDPLTLPPPAFDTIIIAGNTDFILQVAPTLSYYDLGPDRALFIGIDKWNRPKVLNEPSLQKTVLTLPIRPAESKFNKIWQAEFRMDANDLAKMAFDATALVITTSALESPVPLSTQLENQAGFIGFSGQFKMSKAGLTERVFEILEISDNMLVKPSIQ